MFLLFQVGIARFHVSFCSCKCHFKSRWIKLPSKAQGSVHGNPAISPSTQLGNFTSIQTGTTTSGQGCEPWSQFTKSQGLLRSFKRATVKIYARLFCRHKATKLDVSGPGIFWDHVPFFRKKPCLFTKKTLFSGVQRFSLTNFSKWRPKPNLLSHWPLLSCKWVL